jgi:hypothetical protein
MACAQRQPCNTPPMRRRDNRSAAAMMSLIKDIDSIYVRNPEPELDLYLAGA